MNGITPCDSVLQLQTPQALAVYQAAVSRSVVQPPLAEAAALHAPQPGVAVQQAGDGLLSATVQEPFMLVIRTAQSLGLDTGLDPGFHGKPLAYEALPRIEAALAQLKQAIRALPAHSARHLSLLDHLIQTQAAIAGALGQPCAPSGYGGVERRGVQVPGGPKPPQG